MQTGRVGGFQSYHLQTSFMDHPFEVGVTFGLLNIMLLRQLKRFLNFRTTHNRHYLILDYLIFISSCSNVCTFYMSSSQCSVSINDWPITTVSHYKRSLLNIAIICSCYSSITPGPDRKIGMQVAFASTVWTRSVAVWFAFNQAVTYVGIT